METQRVIMGILNCTPDSFSHDGRFRNIDAAYDKAQSMISAGASIIDIGGESSRPNSVPVSQEEELDRVLPVIERLTQNSAVQISIDTTKPVVAEQALKLGASIVNDISGGIDPLMRKVVAGLHASIILMHKRPFLSATLEVTRTNNVVVEIKDFFHNKSLCVTMRALQRSKSGLTQVSALVKIFLNTVRSLIISRTLFH